MAGIKKNFLYNSILTTANYIFPILVFPYVSRVLGVTNIGICNFVDSIVQNFILVSMLGIPIVGIREIVVARRDRIKLNQTFSSIFYINAVLTAVAVAILLCCTYLIDDLFEYKKLMYVGVFKLIANFLMIEWFFKGLENFKYITIRSVAVRSIYVISVFIFVKTSDDYIIYYILTCSVFVVNAITNLLYSRRFVSLTFHAIPFKVIAKPIGILGIYMIFTSFYTSFNVSFLGIETDTTEVGYFTTASKIYAIILALFSAFTSVMLPRMTDILADEDFAKFKGLLAKCCRLFYSIIIPVACFGLLYAEDIIMLIAGPGYSGAVLPMRICMVVMLIVGYEQVIIIQGLMPLKRDKSILINSIVGGLTALSLCFFLVPYLKATGSSLVWLCSELATMLSASFFIKKYIGFKFPVKVFVTRVLYNIPLALSLFFASILFNPGDDPLRLIVSLSVGAIIMVIYTGVLQCAILKEPVFIGFLAKLHLKKK